MFNLPDSATNFLSSFKYSNNSKHQMSNPDSNGNNPILHISAVQEMSSAHFEQMENDFAPARKVVPSDAPTITHRSFSPITQLPQLQVPTIITNPETLPVATAAPAIITAPAITNAAANALKLPQESQTKLIEANEKSNSAQSTSGAAAATNFSAMASTLQYERERVRVVRNLDMDSFRLGDMDRERGYVMDQEGAGFMKLDEFNDYRVAGVVDEQGDAYLDANRERERDAGVNSHYGIASGGNPKYWADFPLTPPQSPRQRMEWVNPVQARETEVKHRHERRITLPHRAMIVGRGVLPAGTSLSKVQLIALEYLRKKGHAYCIDCKAAAQRKQFKAWVATDCSSSSFK